MIYLSVDIETTGLDENENQIIEFGAIIEDSNNPKTYEESKKYRRVLLARDGKYVFGSYAAKINAGLIEMISHIENGKSVDFSNNPNLTQTAFFSDELMSDFKIWLLANGFKENSHGVIQIVSAGKNFGGFDKRFINTLEPETYGIKFNYKSIDPTTPFIDWVNDTQPPSTDECKKRAGLTGDVKHEALADAWDIIQLLRLQYANNLFHTLN